MQAIDNAATLEITGGGTATLNGNDGHGLIALIDQAMVLDMGATAFISAIAKTAGTTLVAQQAFQTLSSLQGGDTLVGATADGTYADTFQGTAAGLDGDTIQNFGKSDTIDITDVLPANVLYTQGNGQGMLAFGGSSLTVAGVVDLTGQFSSDGNGGTYVTLVPSNTVDVAADTAVLARPDTVYQGGGNDQFYVDATTIADTIDGGGDDSSLGVLNGGTSVMGANITGFGQVHLLGGTPGDPGFTFTANATQNLVILGSQGNDVITVGDASQTVFTFGQSSLVEATATTAGARVQAITNAATLEITGGGTATLNGNDGHGLIALIDQATVLNMGAAAFISAIAKTAGTTLVAQQAFQTLSSLQGGDTLVGATADGTYADTFQGTAAGLDGDTIQNFGKSDTIDITDVLPANVQYTAGEGQGTLAFGGSNLTISGAIDLTTLQVVGDGNVGTLVKFSSW